MTINDHGKYSVSNTVIVSLVSVLQAPDVNVLIIVLSGVLVKAKGDRDIRFGHTCNIVHEVEHCHSNREDTLIFLLKN